MAALLITTGCDPAYGQAMFCVNGVASFFHHMTALRSWGQTDGDSMVFLSWLVVAFVWDELIETCSIQARSPSHALAVAFSRLRWPCMAGTARSLTTSAAATTPAGDGATRR